MIKFRLEGTEHIELIKLLKFTNICGSGGEAKHIVEEGEVKLNGVLESRKRAKIRSGDKIEVFNEVIEVE
ncbi:MAG: RNA-binding protein [Marinilabiliales bacterium]|nr:MAG: RNA-binding protein [Marinilabiliales bacterium]